MKIVAQKPKHLTVDEVPAYVKAHYNTTISKATVYSWIKKGRRGIYLQHDLVKTDSSLVPNVKMVTPEHIDAFVTAIKDFFASA